MKDYMKTQVVSHLTTTMGVKPYTVKEINLNGFFATIIKVATLERTEKYVNGEPLSEFKLDSRLKRFVLPRGVYVDADLLAINYVDKSTYQVEANEVLSAAEFQVVQTQLLGACRKAVSFDTDLEQASAPVLLAEVSSRACVDGKVHYTNQAVLPINLITKFYQEFWYNYSADDMINLLVAEVMSSFK